MKASVPKLHNQVIECASLSLVAYLLSEEMLHREYFLQTLENFAIIAIQHWYSPKGRPIAL